MRLCAPCVYLLTISIVGISHARASDLTWDGSIGNWDNDASWLSTAIEPTISDNVTINSGHVDVTLLGEEADWININGSSLTISSGGSLTNSVGHINYDYNEPASVVTVTGAGSSWHNSQDLYVGYFADAVLHIDSGGIVEVGRETWVDASNKGLGSGIVSFDGGTLNTGSLLTSPQYLMGSGTINTNGLVTDMDLVFNASQGTSQQIVIDDLPGQSVTLNLDISDIASAGVLGAGYHGSGTLAIQDGVVVSSKRGVLGEYPTSLGEATVSGLGSTWNVLGRLEVGGIGDYFLGEGGGDGVLNIDARGLVISEDGWIGGEQTGVVNVTGDGSSWICLDGMAIGLFGNGFLNIENGASVTTHGSSIASDFYAIGVVTVTGAGSTWTVVDRLIVGSLGEGSLIITNGGVVESGTATMAIDGGSRVTVTGPNSIWLNTGNLYMGGTDTSPGGRAELTVSDDGTVDVGGTIKLWSNALISGDGGVSATSILSSGVVSPGNSIGVLTISGDYSQEATGRFAIEVNGGGGVPGTDHDQLVINGAATLNGHLNVTLLDSGYLPEIGDSYVVLTATSISGVFSGLNGRIISGDRGFAVFYPDSQNVIVEVVPMSPIDGDLDGDGFVGIGDLNIVLGNWNQYVTSFVWPLGDYSGDGFVGIEDLNGILGNWNTGTPPPIHATALIPEPTLGIIILFTFILRPYGKASAVGQWL